MEKAKCRLVEAEYMQNFQCLAGDCACNCCHGWRIDVTRAEYHRMRSAAKEKALYTLLEKGLRRNKRALKDERYAEMLLDEKGDCACLDENGLCRLQLLGGHEILSRTCQSFPRVVLLAGDNVEKGCSTACEEVVNLLWGLPRSLDFYCSVSEEVVHFGTLLSPVKGQEAAFDRFFEIQSLCIDLLQNHAYPLDERVVLLGVALQGLTERADDSQYVENWLKKYGVLVKGDQLHEALERFPRDAALSAINNAMTCQFIVDAAQYEEQGLLCKVIDRFGITGNIRETLQIDLLKLKEAKAEAELLLRGNDFFLENVIVNLWFILGAPLGAKGIWSEYMAFCQLYSLLKFLLAGGIDKGASPNEIFQVVVLWSRMLSHNKLLLESLVEQFVHNQSDTLAHMAILVNG